MLKADGLLDIASKRGRKPRSRGSRKCVCKHDQLEPGESERSCLYLYLRRAELKVLASLASTASALAESLGAGRCWPRWKARGGLIRMPRKLWRERGINFRQEQLASGIGGASSTPVAGKVLAKSWQKLSAPTQPILVWLGNLRMTG
jgi:hypothetical protein